MTHIVARHVRVIPNESDSDATDDTVARQGSRSRGFDYAALLGRRRVLHRLGGQSNADAHAGSQGSHADDTNDDDAPTPPRPFHSLPGDEPGHDDSPATVASDTTHTTPLRAAIGARVADAAQPVVNAVYRQQQRVVQLLGSLAREIGTFCGDPSIVEAGNWEVQLPLDQNLLPHTTLYLTLSRFSLQLRFDTTDVSARQLLLEHSALLERELDTLLRAWGEARDIELTVW
ncbi:type III secretion control protein HpaP [Paraburkholderia sp. GAS199]|uniref:type III secretion system protein SctP n=1 Tax=Paraburkholderia sp. GAS199 TaxID=3035126 RepID=UPI003D234756